jgi:PDZ domain-containing protein
MMLLAGIALSIPTGFAVRSPGPTADTLGEVSLQVDGESEDVPLVEVSGAPTYPASGKLLLTTVSVGGGPVSSVFGVDVLYAWVMPGRTVLPADAVFATGITREQQQEQSAAQMASSKETATAAALSELGMDVHPTLQAAGITADSPSDGIVHEGDIITSIDGHPVNTHAALMDRLEATEPGSDVVLGLTREGAPLDVTITTGEAETADGHTRAALGILVASTFHFPVDVEIQLEDIGGPSAGMMFALAIIDRLTPADELDGRSVAGTGTVEADGTVGPIGGVQQKMAGALRDGARYFLTPQPNCAEAIGHIPAGLRVIPVSTLAQALDAITAIGQGEADGLPVCVLADSDTMTD